MNKQRSIVLVVVLVALGGYLAYAKPQFLQDRTALVSDANAYQAVFLDNNQVYFGKLEYTRGKSLKLTDVYYLQENAQKPPTAKGEPQPRFTLLKLGKQELHGPTDMMVINRDHVLLWENMRPDSEVVKKIVEAKAQPK